MNQDTAATADPRANITRRSFLRTTALGGIGVATMLTLDACGMTKANTPGSSGSHSAVLNAAFERPIISLDPHGDSDVDEGTLLACRHIFDPLVIREGSNIKPNVAKSWDQPDPRTWVFHLRDDVKYSDGTPLIADDVKACLERVAASDTPQASLWEALDSVEATDPHTVTIKTKTPLGTTLSNLTLLFIVPASKLKQKNFFNKPIGSGPFKVASFTASDHVNLEANKSYWGSTPRLSTLNLPYIPETSTRLTSLKTGDVDITWSIPPDQMASMQSAAGVKVVATPSYVYYFNWFNCGRPPFDDARVRQAMWHAIDVNSVVKSLFGSTAQVMDAPIPSTVFGYAAQQPYSYDPAKARQLLAEAGHPHGLSTSMMWCRDIAPQIRSVAEAFNSYWTKVGVHVKLQELEQAEWLKRLLALDWDMDLQNNSVTTGDADYTLGRLYTSTANRMGYSNPKLDRILNGARSTTDQSHRQQLYSQACEIIWDDAVGIFPLQIKATYGLQASVKGFTPSPDNQPMLTNVTPG